MQDRHQAGTPGFTRCCREIRTESRTLDASHDPGTRAVIFDVDGTLVDSVDIHAEAWRDAFAEFGHQIPLAEIRGQIGKGGDQLMPVFLSEAELKQIGERLESRRADILKVRYLHRITAFPKVPELFRRLRETGVRIVLASSAKNSELATYKKVAGIEDLVEEQTASDDAEKSKPHPDIFQAALERAKVPSDSALVIGDTPYDAQAARKAGLHCIGVLCGGFPEHDLRQVRLHRHLRRPSRTAREGRRLA